MIVDITTGAGDNAHRIFQSLNGTGVGLTQADLLRNYIFMLLPSRGETVYEQLLRPMEQLVGSVETPSVSARASRITGRIPG